jgi:hypothetical protein
VIYSYSLDVGIGIMKKLFLICPIGDAESNTRERSDSVLAYIVKPIALSCGYEVLRGDQTGNPTIITTDIINNLIESDLVIADLTDHNPNVYYELGIVHALRKPVIQIIQKEQKVPFDVSQIRTIDFDYQSVPSVNQCQAQIRDSIQKIEAGGGKVDNPISLALDINAFRQSTIPVETSLKEILTLIEKSSLADDKYTKILSSLDNILEKISSTSPNEIYEQEIEGYKQRIDHYKEEVSNLESRFHEQYYSERFHREKADLLETVYSKEKERTEELIHNLIWLSTQTNQTTQPKPLLSKNSHSNSELEEVRNENESESELADKPPEQSVLEVAKNDDDVYRLIEQDK